jgi:protein-S-isoprenylcysteine O-methyltransferase Ste14
MVEVVRLIFTIDVIVLFVMLFGVIWSVAVHINRIWPPPSRHSWQHLISWILFYIVFGSNVLLIVLEWNTWMFSGFERFIIGIPLIVLGSLLLYWGIRTLGTSNTSGMSDGFVKSGPYRFTRNPQYLGDMVLFFGLSILSNSLHLWITHILLIVVFTVTTLAEEIWLEEQYGEGYRRYFEGTSRFL